MQPIITATATAKHVLMAIPFPHPKSAVILPDYRSSPGAQGLPCCVRLSGALWPTQRPLEHLVLERKLLPDTAEPLCSCRCPGVLQPGLSTGAYHGVQAQAPSCRIF